MKLETARLSIRPRSLLECLDLSFRLCGKHFLGLSLVVAPGVIIALGLNHWVLSSIVEEKIADSLLLLLLALEAPWMTAPITLYLGQVTFSSRFSLKQALRMFASSFWSMLLFQGILRLICLMTCVLAPFVFFGMYYLNPIILLERPSLGKVWQRRGALTRNITGKVILFQVTDLLVLQGGSLLVGQFIASVAAVWVEGIGGIRDFFSGEGDLEGLWCFHLGFLLTLCFLAVFRFITYLDCRIRREGWDVELLLRAEARSLAELEGT